MSATGQRVHDVILRGGRTLRLRPPSEADAEAMRRFLTDLSPASMRMRVDDAMVAAFLDPNWIDEGILLATAVGEDESDRVIGTAGFTRLRDPRAAEVSPENRPMLRVFEDSGFEVSRTDEGGEIRVEFPIRSDERYREAVDLRDHRAVGPSLKPVLDPSAVAVVGASARDGSIGGAIFRNIVDAGYTGSVFPVNRSGEPVAGHP